MSNYSSLDEFIDYVNENGHDDGDLVIDEIYSYMDDLLGGLFQKSFNDSMQMLGGPRILEEPDTPSPKEQAITKILKHLDLKKISTVHLLAFLVTTRPLAHLPARKDFYKRAFKEVQGRGRPAKKLMGGLEF